MKIDLAQHRVFLHEKEIALTRKEFGILACLADRAGHLVTPSFLLLTVWGPRSEHYIQTLRVHIGNLRKRIALYSGIRIEAVRGAGYRLVEDSSPEDGCLHCMANPVTPSGVAEDQDLRIAGA